MNGSREVKPHIAVFGKCNSGKSTLINTLVGQDVSIVSSQKGTTTDSVKKTMELGGVGAVVLIDTAGIDDTSELGKQRVKKAYDVFYQIDLAIIVFGNDFCKEEQKLIEACKHYETPFILVYTKNDLTALRKDLSQTLQQVYGEEIILFSNKDSQAKERLTAAISKKLPETSYKHKSLLEGIINAQSVVLLVTPIDSSAPQGRMILPQVQTIRDVLDNQSINIVCKETDLEYTLKNIYKKPDLVITDSQVFEYVNRIVPKSIRLTSFSIVLARMKGCFDQYVKGTPYLDKLKDGDRVLMLESCTHQPTCEDIGRVKLPAWISKYTGKKLHFEALSGLTDVPKNIKDYAMVIQCGGCMATQKQLHSRLLPAIENGIPISNYGICIAYINGIFQRATEALINKSNSK